MNPERNIVDEYRLEKRKEANREIRNAILVVAGALTACGILGQCTKAKGHGGDKHSIVAKDHFETQHINHIYDEKGEHIFDQIVYQRIFDGQARVEAWRLLKCPHQLPVPDNGTPKAVWLDGEVMREVTSNSVMETWEQYDFELHNRLVFPREERRNLSRIIKPE